MKIKSVTVAAVLAACITGSSARAGTIVTALAGGPFFSGDITSIPSAGLDNGNVYDFTFAWAGAPSITTIAADTTGSSPVTQLQLFTGDPGSGAVAAQTAIGFGTSLTFSVSPGDYYAEVTPGEVHGPGISPSAIPEPAVWALMLIGVGAMGAATRGRRSATASAAA